MSIQLANELWPTESNGLKDGDDESDIDGGGADDLEKQIAKEVASMKRPRKETRFGRSSTSMQRTSPHFHVANCLTNTPCGTPECHQYIIHSPINAGSGLHLVQATCGSGQACHDTR